MMAKFTKVRNRKTNAQSQSHRISFHARKDRGVALIISLMLLTLLSVMSVIMVLTVSPDMMINGHYGNFRGSFYAADSGLNMARQQLVNQIQTQLSTTACTGWGGTGGCTTLPLVSSNAGTVIANLLASTSGGYGAFGSLNMGQAASSWPENFQIVNTTSCPSTFTLPTTNSGGGANPTAMVTNSQTGQVTTYQYQFSYQLCSLGRALGSQQVYTSENGYITVNVVANTSTTQQATVSFSSFGAFINNYSPCTGALVPGTMTGPMFTNGAWQFGTSGPYIFTDPVGQANAKADYYFGGTCIQSASSSYKSGSQTIAPTFQQGFNLGQASVALPANDFSQKWAVLDGVGCGEGGTTCGTSAPPSPANSDLHNYLKDINGNAYSSNGATSGVYLPYSCVGGSSCVNTVNGGGIYVEGGAGVVLSTGSDSSGNLTQVYTITQGSTTTTVTTNIATKTTTVTSGSKTLSLAGVPMNKVSTPQPGTLLYVDGTISSLSGPTGQSNQSAPAIQDGAQVTVAANGDVNITGNILYKHEPVTQDTSDSLISGNDYNQVLGVFTASGNITLTSPYNNNNLEVDGALAAIGQNCASNKCGFTSSDNINTFTNVGGQIQGNIFSANMQTENTYFDRRFTSKAGFAPPWFPSTTLPLSDIQNGLPPTIPNPPTITRMSWTTTPQ